MCALDEVKGMDVFMKNIKKMDIALVLGVILIIVLGCFVMKGTKAEPSYELPLKLEGDYGYNKISYSEYQEKIDNGDSFVVTISREGCTYCQQFKPVATDFAESNKLPMYYIDTDDMTEDEWSLLGNSNTFFKKNGDDWGTPTTLVLAGSECVDSVEGSTDADTLLALFEKYFDVDSYKSNDLVLE